MPTTPEPPSRARPAREHGTRAILDRYAETRGWDVDDTLLRGTFLRLAFGRRKQLRKRFRHRKG